MKIRQNILKSIQIVNSRSKVIKKVLKSSKIGQQLEHQRQLSLEHFHTTLITDLAISCQFVSIFSQS